MFLKTNKAVEAAALNATVSKKGAPSVISTDMHILGNLVSDGLIDIDGSVEGNVKGDQITVRPNGKITGDLVAQTVHVYGEVRGLIRAGAIHLYASCHVEGIIMYHSLSVEDGAFVDGKFKRMQENTSTQNWESRTEDEEDGDSGLLDSGPGTPANLRLIS